MCGIAGVIGDRRAAELVRGMIGIQRHRGPDSEGYFASEDVALGHCRLAILDLSELGAQPMTSEDGRFTITFNGEIFNYVELRRELGGPFRSGSDTEVLLRACAEWGVEKTLARSIGMFAFALWDSVERELTLARDRVGEKPLVYFHQANRFAFSSELKALSAFTGGAWTRTAWTPIWPSVMFRLRWRFFEAAGSSSQATCSGSRTVGSISGAGGIPNLLQRAKNKRDWNASNACGRWSPTRSAFGCAQTCR